MNNVINVKGNDNFKTDNIDEEIIKLIIDIGELSDNIGLDTTFDEIKLDSIKFITIIIEVETNYEIEFDDVNMLVNNYESIGDFVEYVKMKIVKE